VIKHVQIEEEIDDETEASALQGKKIQTKWKLLVLHVQPIIHFDLSVARNEDPKNLLLRKGEMCNIVVVNPVLQNERKKYFVSFSEKDMKQLCSEFFKKMGVFPSSSS
jgi:hypothetical protein